ncbi:hypothetical protein Mpsy_0316 [Methanolobus psychrophilus R15]|nr:hypothetical protein Mpsy_0316 [Methanolobus psychrophilus R15]
MTSCAFSHSLTSSLLMAHEVTTKLNQKEMRIYENTLN